MMSPLQKKKYFCRDGPCIICGEITYRLCVCDAVFYCSSMCKKLHRKAGHKVPCLRFKSLKKLNVRAMKSLTSVLPVEVQVAPPPAWSYEDFIYLFNSGYKKPILALNYRPCGLNNRGNTCFLNVTLQCLLFTRPLFAYLTGERSHRSRCTRREWCFLCEFESHIGCSILNCYPFAPSNILRGLRHIGGDFSWGRQEDAHEFMRFAIDAMQSSCLAESNAGPADSTLIRYTFGGQLRSGVTCTECGKTSYRYENMMDLAVEIGENDYVLGDEDYTLEQCLDKFTDYEWLEGDNKYKCDGCEGYVRAKKRIQIQHAPNVLTIALKRFNSNGIGKLNDKIVFPTKLNLSRYLSPACGSGRDPDDNIYKLYAVVVHKDLTEDVAHYICFTKDFRGNWFEIDDGKVKKVQLWEVTQERAYMLMYTRARAHPSPLRDPRPIIPDQPLMDLPQPQPQLPDQPQPLPSKDEDEGAQPTKDEDKGLQVEPGQSQQPQE